MTDKPKESERSLTDESLRTERDNADRVLAESKSILEEDADEIVRRAREVADSVLDEARDKADEHLARDGARLSIVDSVEEDRASADELLATSETRKTTSSVGGVRTRRAPCSACFPTSVRRPTGIC